jgi:predicted acetyltransferase
MDYELRPVSKKEMDDFLIATEVAFSDEMKPEERDRFKKNLRPERTLAVFDGKDMVATAGAFDFTLTVPGGRVPAAGVTVVGVAPTHRRRGVLRSMMKKQLEDSRAAGEPIAVLWASESGIYTKFGYGLAAEIASIRVERPRASFREVSERFGTTRLISHEEALDVLPRVYDRVCAETPGMFERTRDWWNTHRLADPEGRRRGFGPLFRVVVEKDGVPEAYALYHAKGEWDDDGIPQGTLDVEESMATSLDAEKTLWDFLFGVDLVDRVEAYFVQVDHPLKFILQDRRHLRMRVRDALWLRVVDVTGALEARTYAAEGRIVFDLADPFCPWNEGVWEFEATAGKAVARRTEDEPELSLTAEDLGALYLGGNTFAQLQRAGRVFELREGAVGRADNLFRTDKAPWCPEIF